MTKKVNHPFYVLSCNCVTRGYMGRIGNTVVCPGHGDRRFIVEVVYDTPTGD